MEETRQPIQPGMCPPEGCPPFDRIECIVVDKVYDSCFQIDQLTRDTIVNTDPYGDWPTGPFAIGQTVACALNGTITCIELSRVDAGGGFFTITLLVTVPVTLTNPNNPLETADRDFTFTKTVTLCCPEGVSPDCSESTLLSCTCVITAVDPIAQTVTVTCDLQVCFVVKCILRVQLLVPSYGFCVPAPCITIPGVCPPLPPDQCF